MTETKLNAVTLAGLKRQLDAAIAASATDDGAALQALSDSLGPSDTSGAALAASKAQSPEDIQQAVE